MEDSVEPPLVYRRFSLFICFIRYGEVKLLCRQLHSRKNCHMKRKELKKLDCDIFTPFTGRLPWGKKGKKVNWSILANWNNYICARKYIQNNLSKSPLVKGILKWQPTPVFLPGESHGQRSLVGYSQWSCKELDTNEQTHTHKGILRASRPRIHGFMRQNSLGDVTFL